MKVSKKISLGVVSLLGALMAVTACGGGSSVTYGTVTGPYLTGKTSKSVYKAFLGSSITTLNYLKSQNAADARHVANFVDPLVMNDEYTILRKLLADTATHNDANTEFTFQIKKGVKWYTYNGSVYKVKGQEQEVKADDFVKSAEVILDYKNASDLSYLLEMFLDGGYEYYCYTMMTNLMTKRSGDSNYPTSGKTKADGSPYKADDLASGTVEPDCKFQYSSLQNASNDLKAQQLMNLIAYESGKSVAEIKNISGADLTDVAAFKRVGVKTGSNPYELVYTLPESMNFFPTVLTYCPFLPVNRTFFDQYKMSGFGEGNDKILYCGPFILNKWQGSDIIYKKNNNYFGADDVHIERVEYKVLEETVGASYTREQFNLGNVDGFSLSTDDSAGWEEYILGPEGTGTIRDPYSGLVNNRELDEIDFLYSFNVNLNRDPKNYNADSKTGSGKSALTAADIENTNRAMHITEFRKMLIDGLMLSKFGEEFTELMGAESVDQYAVNTFVPKGFARDEEGKDYVEYYFETVANKKGISVDDATNMWKQQQYAGREVPDTEDGYAFFKTNYVEPAFAAIDKYNAACEAGTITDGEGNKLTAADKITYPIKIEALGSGGIDPKYKKYTNAWAQDLNEKVNGCRINQSAPYTSVELPTCDGKGYPKMIIQENDKVTDSATFSTFSNGSYYNFGNVWGWGPDYADPLTYMNCYTSSGDMTKYLGYDADTLTYYVDANGEMAEKKIAEEYTRLVNLGRAETSDTKERYRYFAEAEYELHYDMYVIRPSHMYGQGWAASVSRAAGYENPNASYGLAANRLTGMWVLKDVPTAEERRTCRELQAELKEEELKKTGSYIAIFDE